MKDKTLTKILGYSRIVYIKLQIKTNKQTKRNWAHVMRKLIDDIFIHIKPELKKGAVNPKWNILKGSVTGQSDLWRDPPPPPKKNLSLQFMCINNEQIVCCSFGFCCWYYWKILLSKWYQLINKFNFYNKIKCPFFPKQ